MANFWLSGKSSQWQEGSPVSRLAHGPGNPLHATVHRVRANCWVSRDMLVVARKSGWQRTGGYAGRQTWIAFTKSSANAAGSSIITS